MELDQIDITVISDQDADVQQVAPAVAQKKVAPRQVLKAPPALQITGRPRQSAGMRYARWVFAIAGVYGLIMTVPLYFVEQRFGQENPPAINHPEFYYGFAGLCVAWQVLFLIIAKDPIRLRPAMLAAIIEKVSFPLAIVPLFMLGRVGMTMLGLSAVDAFFAIAFGVAYYSCKTKQVV